MIRRILLSASFAFLIGAPAGAAEISVKSLSGPPSEFAEHRLPGAEKIGVASNMLVVEGTGSKGAGASVILPPGETTTTFSASAGVGFSVVQATSVYPYFAPSTFYGPDGSRYSFDGSSITCNWGYCDEFTADIQMEPFPNSSGGVAILSISGGQVPTNGTWNLAVENSLPQTLNGTAPQIESTLTFDDNVVEVAPVPDPCQALVVPDEPCPFLPRSGGFDLVDGASPVLRLAFRNRELRSRGAERVLHLSALRLTVFDARSREAVVTEDFGFSRLASLAKDAAGATLVQLPPLSAGEYSVRLDVRGTVPGIGPIERTALYFLPILPRGYQLTGDVATTVLDDDRLELNLAVDLPSAALPHVYAYAEVWTGDGKEPIAWIGGMTQPRFDATGQARLPLVLDGRWLALAKSGQARELRLRNVRIQDPDTFIPLSRVAETRFRVAALPPAAALGADQVAVGEDLYVGRGDRNIDVPDEPEAVHPDGQSLTFSQTGIFLVHGWCSGVTWPTSHFGRPGRVGGTETFYDPSASRSHDSFARQIRDQGAAHFSDSFTVVAHSQGGAASTHLRAFYGSLLDLSFAPRRIQSMGTPYNGSSLMDYYLATGPLGWLIATIFGQCTQSFDLGTLGSQLWLSSLPSWVRSEVYYYRTGFTRPSGFWQKLQFWRWRCNAASFVIPGWDDGVTADWQGVLSGAHNMGTTEGECHTSGMHHSAQTANSSRNDILDREGRPSSTNRARSATTSASSTYSPGCSPGLHCYFASRVNDGDRNTAVGGNTSWCNNNGAAMPQWVQLTWSLPITFTQVDVYTSAGYELRDFRIEYRATSTGPWITLTTVTGNSSTYRGPFTYAPTTAQAIRILATSGSAAQPGYARVNEIEVY